MRSRIFDLSGATDVMLEPYGAPLGFFCRLGGWVRARFGLESTSVNRRSGIMKGVGVGGVEHESFNCGRGSW